MRKIEKNDDLEMARAAWARIQRKLRRNEIIVVGISIVVLAALVVAAILL